MHDMALRMRQIPQLSPFNISVWDEIYPLETDISTGIWQLRAPALLIIWRGTGPGSKQTMEVWRHTFSVVIRSTLKPETSYFAAWNGMVNGFCMDTGCSFRLDGINSFVYAMETPAILRQTLFVTPETRLDYHEVSISLTEKGDYHC